MHFTTRALVCAAAIGAATPLWAQTFPSQGDTAITDDAQIIDDATEARILIRLDALKESGGDDVRIVTLPSMAFYTMGEDIDVYAGMLADEFGLTATPDGNWALFLVFAEDRELQIETGPAYASHNDQVQGVIDALIVPQFQAGEYGRGIEAGTNGLVDRVIIPATQAAATPPDTQPTTPPAVAEPAATDTTVPSEGGSGLWWFLGGLVAVVGGIVALVKRNSAKLAATPCPSCGKTGLTRERVTLTEATFKTEGRGETRTTCPSCGHSTAVPFTISKKTPDQKSGNTPAAAKGVKPAGDKTQGGGATGKW